MTISWNCRFHRALGGENLLVKLGKLIRRRIRIEDEGIGVVGDVNAVIAANVNERGGSHTSVSSRQHVVQRRRGASPGANVDREGDIEDGTTREPE